jgi:hypothetical protein
MWHTNFVSGLRRRANSVDPVVIACVARYLISLLTTADPWLDQRFCISRKGEQLDEYEKRRSALL